MLQTILVPDEEHLGGFSQMGFHVISSVKWMNVVDIGCYVNVCLLYIVTVIVECMTQYYWSVKEWMNDKPCWHVMYDFMVNLLIYNISRTLFVISVEIEPRC